MRRSFLFFTKINMKVRIEENHQFNKLQFNYIDIERKVRKIIYFCYCYSRINKYSQIIPTPYCVSGPSASSSFYSCNKHWWIWVYFLNFSSFSLLVLLMWNEAHWAMSGNLLNFSIYLQALNKWFLWSLTECL